MVLLLAAIVQFPIVKQQLKVEGFIVTRWGNRWMEGIAQLAKWIKEGKLKYRETVTDGFEKMPEAFIDIENMVKSKVFLYNKKFEGLPKVSDFKLVEENVPALKDGEFLAQAVYLSVDPYMRAYAVGLPTGIPMIGGQIAKYVSMFAINTGNDRFATHTVDNGGASNMMPTYVLPDFGSLPVSLGVGILGMPGVIGIAGSDEKGKWLVNELGFDHFINYKTQDIETELKKLAPKGVDCYFDNVGGETTNKVMANMNLFGRISMCGAISGFIVTRWANRWMEGIEQLAKWIKEGKLKYRETVTDGFEKMPEAFIDMLKGGNTGKAVVKA
nr:unnamed protein product [Callosobruchus analis]